MSKTLPEFDLRGFVPPDKIDQAQTAIAAHDVDGLIASLNWRDERREDGVIEGGLDFVSANVSALKNRGWYERAWIEAYINSGFDQRSEARALPSEPHRALAVQPPNDQGERGQGPGPGLRINDVRGSSPRRSPRVSLIPTQRRAASAE
jgi:hypothetical protein